MKKLLMFSSFWFHVVLNALPNHNPYHNLSIETVLLGLAKPDGFTRSLSDWHRLIRAAIKKIKESDTNTISDDIWKEMTKEEKQSWQCVKVLISMEAEEKNLQGQLDLLQSQANNRDERSRHPSEIENLMKKCNDLKNQILENLMLRRIIATAAQKIDPYPQQLSQ